MCKLFVSFITYVGISCSNRRWKRHCVSCFTAQKLCYNLRAFSGPIVMEGQGIVISTKGETERENTKSVKGLSLAGGLGNKVVLRVFFCIFWQFIPDHVRVKNRTRKTTLSVSAFRVSHNLVIQPTAFTPMHSCTSPTVQSVYAFIVNFNPDATQSNVQE